MTAEVRGLVRTCGEGGGVGGGDNRSLFRLSGYNTNEQIMPPSRRANDWPRAKGPLRPLKSADAGGFR